MLSMCRAVVICITLHRYTEPIYVYVYILSFTFILSELNLYATDILVNETEVVLYVHDHKYFHSKLIYSFYTTYSQPASQLPSIYSISHVAYTKGRYGIEWL